MMPLADAREAVPAGPGAAGPGALAEPELTAGAARSFRSVRTGRKIRPNLFQRAMLGWRTLRPYSAAHAVRLDGALDLPRLRSSIAQRLQAMGLTGLVLAPRGRWYRFDGGPWQADLRVVDGGSAPLDALAAEMENQLDTPFAPDGPQTPFRFFAVTQPDSFYLTLVYDHYIAGGESIVLLLRAIAQRYASPAAADLPEALPKVRAVHLRRLFLRHPIHAVRALIGLPGMYRRWRTSARPPTVPGKLHDGVALLRFDPPLLAALLRTARAWDVTLHDLFIASLLLALSPLAEARRGAARRTGLAVSSILNLRSAFFREPGEVFGQFLASFRAGHPVPPGIDLATLAREIGAQTKQAKAGKAYLQSLLAAGLGGLTWRLLSPEQRARYYAKHYAVWGGVTTLNAGALWGEGKDGDMDRPPLDYIRAVSTGPATPLVLATTIAGGALRVGVTYRLPDMSREMADEVIAGFRRCLESAAR